MPCFFCIEQMRREYLYLGEVKRVDDRQVRAALARRTFGDDSGGDKKLVVAGLAESCRVIFHCIMAAPQWRAPPLGAEIDAMFGKLADEILERFGSNTVAWVNGITDSGAAIVGGDPSDFDRIITLTTNRLHSLRQSEDRETKWQFLCNYTDEHRAIVERA
jgi:hypothetical protein